MSVQASVRSYVGVAKEVTKGTPVTPTDFIPVLASLRSRTTRFECKFLRVYSGQNSFNR